MSSWFRCSVCGQAMRRERTDGPECPRCGGHLVGQTDFLTLPESPEA